MNLTYNRNVTCVSVLKFLLKHFPLSTHQPGGIYVLLCCCSERGSETMSLEHSIGLKPPVVSVPHRTLGMYCRHGVDKLQLLFALRSFTVISSSILLASHEKCLRAVLVSVLRRKYGIFGHNQRSTGS
ncbi:hypothetical protein PTI98_008283 [Pleurotus ostreatus]|nr:hypothetical protein PTI98_008283 [Pleurotus ostreatus]